MSISILVKIDFDTDNPVEAYKQLHDVFRDKEDVPWESTDEWIDDYGALELGQIRTAIATYYNEVHKEIDELVEQLEES